MKHSDRERKRIVPLLQEVIGAPFVLTAPDEMAPYCREWRGRHSHQALCVVRPQTAQEVSQLLERAARERIPIIPQTGNTGLVGGQVPFQPDAEVILSLERLNRIRSFSIEDGVVVAEAGVILQTLQQEAEERGCFFPLSLASEGSCGVGGTLATNAGGLSVLAYGTARDLCLGLEVVTMGGEILPLLSPLRKRNMGYDLKALFLGSEGTLGVITAASLKLFPKPTDFATAFVSLSDLSAALPFLSLALLESGSWLTAMELIPRLGLCWVHTYYGVPLPVSLEAEWYVLLEVSTSARAIDLQALCASLLSQALEQGYLLEAVLAQTLAQRDLFWDLREKLSAVQKCVGASIKHDISVPRSQIPVLITEASRRVLNLLPNARLLPFGHLGDGNIHFNISVPEEMETASFMAYEEEIHDLVYSLVATLGGALSAEHGIGQIKRERLAHALPPSVYAMMRHLKKSFDPLSLLNPGKVILHD